MAYLNEWLMLVVLNGLALMSPGPDFVMSVRNSLVYSRRAGIFTALGFSFGMCVHVFYCLIGIAAIISQSIIAFSIIKYLGAAYLIYIGYKALFSRGFESKTEAHAEDTQKVMTNWQAVRSGFITNVLNPKATMFFLAMFTQIIDPHTPLTVQIIYGLTCMIMTFGWFTFVAIVLTNPAIKNRFLRLSKWIDKTLGGVLIMLGLKIATSKGMTP